MYKYTTQEFGPNIFILIYINLNGYITLKVMRISLFCLILRFGTWNFISRRCEKRREISVHTIASIYIKPPNFIKIGWRFFNFYIKCVRIRIFEVQRQKSLFVNEIYGCARHGAKLVVSWWSGHYRVDSSTMQH